MDAATHFCVDDRGYLSVDCEAGTQRLDMEREHVARAFYTTLDGSEDERDRFLAMQRLALAKGALERLTQDSPLAHLREVGLLNTIFQFAELTLPNKRKMDAPKRVVEESGCFPDPVVHGAKKSALKGTSVVICGMTGRNARHNGRVMEVSKYNMVSRQYTVDRWLANPGTTSNGSAAEKAAIARTLSVTRQGSGVKAEAVSVMCDRNNFVPVQTRIMPVPGGAAGARIGAFGGDEEHRLWRIVEPFCKDPEKLNMTRSAAAREKRAAALARATGEGHGARARATAKARAKAKIPVFSERLAVMSGSCESCEFLRAEFGPQDAFAGLMVRARPLEADRELENAQSLAGAVAVVVRGVCGFVEKAIRAQAAGAIAVVVINTEDTHLHTMADSEGKGGGLTVPSVVVASSMAKFFEDGALVTMSKSTSDIQRQMSSTKAADASPERAKSAAPQGSAAIPDAPARQMLRAVHNSRQQAIGFNPEDQGPEWAETEDRTISVGAVVEDDQDLEESLKAAMSLPEPPSQLPEPATQAEEEAPQPEERQREQPIAN